jgi:deoxyribonuclease V
MKLPPARHRWDLSPTAAIRLQQRLAPEVRQVTLAGFPRLVAGGDVAFSPDATQVIAGWVVWDVKKLCLIETVLATRPVNFPYIPGLLSFREIPALMAAARKLRSEPDAFMLDGQGFSHPRRFGLASHAGILLGRPTIGCAKSRLCGTHDTPVHAVGASKPLMDGDELIGRVLRTQQDTSPLYISVGHLITLEDAIRVVLRCCTKFRLPEPTRLAHHLVTAERGRLSSAQSPDRPQE